jgi:RNA polymerase sigma factor (sigma-70 family)
MITKHDVYGRVEVDQAILNGDEDFVEVKLFNGRDIFPTDYLVVGKAALEDKGGYKPKGRTTTIIQDYLPLAYSAASQHYSEEAEWEELVQVAALGLCEAAERHDSTRNTSFAAFAKPYISGYLKNYLNPERNGKMNMVELSSGVVEEMTTVDVEDNDMKTVLYGAMEALTPKQKFVMEMVYIEGHTQEEVAEMLSITQEGVAKLVGRSTVALRKQLVDVYH